MTVCPGTGEFFFRHEEEKSYHEDMLNFNQVRGILFVLRQEDYHSGRTKAMTTARIQARFKQIDFGYNTLGYARYIKLVPKDARSCEVSRHPRTPDPYQSCSKRNFDGQIKKWRRLLHAYDPKEDFEELQVGKLIRVQRARLCSADISVSRFRTCRLSERDTATFDTTREKKTNKDCAAFGLCMDGRRGLRTGGLGDWESPTEFRGVI